jgi:ERF superfamily
MRMSEKIDKVSEAIVKAQAGVKAPPLDSVNPHYGNRYASLAAVREAVLPAFHAHGLALIQSPGAGEKGPSLTTLILHTSGQWIEFEPIVLPVQRPDAQGHGSALTYARRYALLAIAGAVADEDDDGAEASRQAAPARPRQGAVSAPPPASQEQIARLEQLFIDLGVNEQQYQACLDEWKIERPEELSSSRLASILDQLEARLETRRASKRTTARSGRGAGG